MPEEEQKQVSTEAEAKIYSLAEVQKHKTSSSLWLVIHNKVYDVTQFLDEVSLILYSNVLTILK